LHDPDAFPAADLVLLRAAGVRAARELKAIAERWRPWRAYAALHLWAAGIAHPASSAKIHDRQAA
jgi:AraC family transcriptional regulator of adaptative response / DNA-3-methyladenine glycosylase II